MGGKVIIEGITSHTKCHLVSYHKETLKSQLMHYITSYVVLKSMVRKVLFKLNDHYHLHQCTSSNHAIYL